MAIFSQEATHTLTSAHSEWGFGEETWAVGVSPQGKDEDWKLWRYYERANVTPHKQNREILEQPEKQRIAPMRKDLMPHSTFWWAHRTKDHALVTNEMGQAGYGL